MKPHLPEGRPIVPGGLEGIRYLLEVVGDDGLVMSPVSGAVGLADVAVSEAAAEGPLHHHLGAGSIPWVGPALHIHGLEPEVDAEALPSRVVDGGQNVDTGAFDAQWVFAAMGLLRGDGRGAA